MWKNSRSDGGWRQFGCLLVVQPSGFKVGGVQKPSAWKSPRHMAGKILQGGHKEKPLLISLGVIQDHLYVVRGTQHENEKSSAKKVLSVDAQHPPSRLIFKIKFLTLRYLWKDLLTSFKTFVDQVHKCKDSPRMLVD